MGMLTAILIFLIQLKVALETWTQTCPCLQTNVKITYAEQVTGPIRANHTLSWTTFIYGIKQDIKLKIEHYQ